VYGLWVTIGLMLLGVARRHESGPRALVIAVILAIPAILFHAGIAASLDTFWSPRGAQIGITMAALDRLPVDLLIYMVLVGAIWGLAAYRRAEALASALTTARESVHPAATEEQPLLVSLGSRRIPVPTAVVEWIGAAGNYVVVNWGGREGLVRSTLAEVEQRLDPTRFARIHRSTLANLAMVESASSLSDGSWRLTMKSGAELVASRTYRDRILERLGKA
jgi:DNA-binding LytR/AlgR family response regulator